jgi:hypothetical protein
MVEECETIDRTIAGYAFDWGECAMNASNVTLWSARSNW